MSNFKARVEDIVVQIPEGRVMTYGQIAALIGSPRAARQVGGAAHFGNPDLPWQRVINAKGGLATGYPGGREAHRLHLEAEGVEFVGDDDSGFFLDLDTYIWSPGEL